MGDFYVPSLPRWSGNVACSREIAQLYVKQAGQTLPLIYLLKYKIITLYLQLTGTHPWTRPHPLDARRG